MARLKISVPRIEAAFTRLSQVIVGGQPYGQCLRRWSEFIRERDDHRCVDCHSRRNLAAHHICRKTFLPEAQYQTGNGITLCRRCHRDVHHGFNNRPDLSLPMDAQGGEKLDHMARLYCILAEDAQERRIMSDDFYYLSDMVLARFKLFQGFDPATPFPGPRVQQAYLIWAQSGMHTRRALVEAMGLPMTDQPILPGEAYIVFEDKEQRATVGAILRNPRWYRP